MLEQKKICERIFRLADGTQAEVILQSSSGALTRFANNELSQRDGCGWAGATATVRHALKKWR